MRGSMRHDGSIRAGQRVLIKADWSSFDGQYGTVAEVRPPARATDGPLVMILIDGERRPMAFEHKSIAIIVGPASEPNLTGAE